MLVAAWLLGTRQKRSLSSSAAEFADGLTDCREPNALRHGVIVETDDRDIRRYGAPAFANCLHRAKRHFVGKTKDCCRPILVGHIQYGDGRCPAAFDRELAVAFDRRLHAAGLQGSTGACSSKFRNRRKVGFGCTAADDANPAMTKFEEVANGQETAVFIVNPEAAARIEPLADHDHRRLGGRWFPVVSDKCVDKNEGIDALAKTNATFPKVLTAGGGAKRTY